MREDHVIPEALAHLAQPFSFAVISDTHFVTRDFLGQNVDVTRPLDIGAYVENVTYSLAPMMDALRTLKPDFLVLTGDVAEPPPDLEDHRKDLQAALDFFATCDIPMLIV
ncbi:MAG: metallophosphoesterase, partial [Candidatus Latescibacteria bacterium]|nr:metallophosphoesterase [Candidatus Latescibacterota bacterium]